MPRLATVRLTQIRLPAGLWAAIIVSCVGVVLMMNGQSSVVAARQSVNTLKISPLRTDIEVQPGTSKTVSVTVTNLTDEAMAVRPVENDFVSGDENGTPALILDATQYAPTHSLKRFMTPLDDVTVPARQTKAIVVTITVPSDAQAGGYFGALRLAPATLDGDRQVNVSASVASLILLTVPGDIVEKVVLSEAVVRQDDKAVKYFNGRDDVGLSVRFQNTGNVQAGLFGKVSVRRGDRVIVEKDFNSKNPRDMILPDSARRWNIPLGQMTKFGNYTVSATFTYGQTNQTVEVTKSFWVIPRATITIAALGVLVLVGIAMGSWLYIRHYKRRHYRRSPHRSRHRRRS